MGCPPQVSNPHCYSLSCVLAQCQKVHFNHVSKFPLRDQLEQVSLHSQQVAVSWTAQKLKVCSM